MEYLQFMFQDLGHFVGCLILLLVATNFLAQLWKNAFKYGSIMIKGYPHSANNPEESPLEKEKKTLLKG